MSHPDERLKRLIDAIFAAHQDSSGLDCETCSEQFTCLVEMVMQGARLGEIMPAVEQHLDCCVECREEYNALLTILRAEQDESGL